MPSAMDLINRAQGKSLTTIAKQGIGGWLFAVAVAAISGLQSLMQLLVFTPIDVLQNIIRTSAQALILGPLGIPATGANITSKALGAFGAFALPMGVIIVLLTFLILAGYRRLPFTSDTPFAGVGVDLIPFVGTEDESEEA